MEEVTEEHFDTTFNTNVRGTLFTVQKALPLFNNNGSIILNGSIASVKGFPRFGVYSASKAAVRSFAHMAGGVEGPRHSRKCVESRNHRYTGARFLR